METIRTSPLRQGRRSPWTSNRRLVGRHLALASPGKQQSESGAMIAAEPLRGGALSWSGGGASPARRPARCGTRTAWPHRRVGVQERVDWLRRPRTGSPTCVRASDCRPGRERVPWMSRSSAPSASPRSCLPDCERGHDPRWVPSRLCCISGSRRADSNSAPQRRESWSARSETALNPSYPLGSRTADATAQAIFRGPGPN
jgi:hypothetical protein